MKNLSCDRAPARELERAQIEVIHLDEPSGDMPSRLRGSLGPIRFTRGLTCWIVDGPLPGSSVNGSGRAP